MNRNSHTKRIQDWVVLSNTIVNREHCLIELHSNQSIPEILPGQFTEVLIPGQPDVFLRRPFSIHDVDVEKNTISLYIKILGKGTRQLSQIKPGEQLNLVYPLGNSFSVLSSGQVLLVGGGCGIAPLKLLARRLKEAGADVHILLGARGSDELSLSEKFSEFGKLYLSTEDGSCGSPGLVTQSPIWKQNPFQYKMIYACGPEPMLKAVAQKARDLNVSCEVSLENTMACGIGACLCCVVKTHSGHQCVCTHGPVFNTKQLKW